MKRKSISFLLACITLITTAQSLPTKTEIISSMRKVNEYWMLQNVAPGNNQWARAAYFTGHLDFYKIYPKESYLNYALLWANNNNWSLNGGTGTRNADNQTCGQVYIDLYLMDTNRIDSRINAIKTSIDNMVNSTKKDDWWWVDALYMAMPVFTRLGVLYNDDKYYSKMYEIYQNNKITRKLYNTNEKLWYRDESFDPPYFTSNGEDSYWSRGNGWVIAAHARTLQLLPANHPNRAEYILTLQEMAEALKIRQREDGFWNCSLDDPNDFGGPETSGTSFFTYSIAWGINNGLLDSATFYPVVVKAWEGLVSKAVQPNGFLSYIQGVGSNPASSQPVGINSTADFGVGAFLLAGTELVKMAGGVMPVPSNMNLNSVKATGRQTVEVRYNTIPETVSALNIANYTISNDIKISEIIAGSDEQTVILRVTDLAPGRYSLSVQNVKDQNGQEIESGESLSFAYSNIASVTASGYENNTSNTPEKTIDFDFGTRWSQEGRGQWIMYDLGEVKQVKSVELAFFNGAARKAFFKIQLSTSITDTTDIFNGESSGTTAGLEKYEFTPANARYVKIVGYGNSQSLWNSITETRIDFDEYGTAIENPVSGDDYIVFPNPFNGNSINIKLSNKFTADEVITISDISGRNVYQQKIQSTNQQIKIENLSLQEGIYILRLKNSSLILSVIRK